MHSIAPPDATPRGDLAVRLALELASVGTTAASRVLALALDAPALARVLEQLARGRD